MELTNSVSNLSLSKDARLTFRFLLSMPAYMENNGVLCTKLVCFYEREAGSTLPAVQASVMLLDPEYGNVKAVSKLNAPRLYQHSPPLSFGSAFKKTSQWRFCCVADFFIACLL